MARATALFTLALLGAASATSVLSEPHGKPGKDCKDTSDCSVAGGTVISSSTVDQRGDCCGLCANSTACVIAATAKDKGASASDGKTPITCTLYSAGAPANGTKKDKCYVKKGGGDGGNSSRVCDKEEYCCPEAGHCVKSVGTKCVSAADCGKEVDYSGEKKEACCASARRPASEAMRPGTC
jgi:hypothetical protein